MKIGIIGAGFVGRAVAGVAVKAGHEVMIANSRNPNSLFSLRAALGCSIGWATEAAEFGEALVIAVPLAAVKDLPADAIGGKRVIDAVNYYPDRDGRIGDLDSGDLGTSELLARHLPEARITKGFNAIRMLDLETNGLPAGHPNRQALPLAGDDNTGKALVAALYGAAGFDTIDVGPLSEGWRFERGQPCYCVRLTATELRHALAQAHPIAA